MGTIVASKAYPEIKQKLDFIVGDGFVTDTAYIVDRYKTRGKDLVLPEPALAYSKSVSQIEIPLLIFAASKDEITTTSDALKLKEKLGKTSEVVEYEGEHLQGFQYKIDEKGFGVWYFEQLHDFISGI
jgi:alpha-beta hydrolase superfamily lysophospholipase